MCDERRGSVGHAGLPVAFGTSHVALAVRAGVKPGQTVLVLGAAGGVGTAAVQVHPPTQTGNSGDLFRADHNQREFCTPESTELSRMACGVPHA